MKIVIKGPRQTIFVRRLVQLQERCKQKEKRRQIHYSKELKLLMTLYRQDTAQREESASYARLKEMIRFFVEQKIMGH